ncbi:MAG: hypothetical protein NTX40_11240, partial [Planctomycetota bacterium]|nr:hypothetical protein [Planctomycetota bacterium]
GGIGQRLADLNVSLGSTAFRAALLLSALLFASTAGKVKAPQDRKRERPRTGVLRGKTLDFAYFLGFGFFLSLQPHVLHIAALLNEVPGGLSLPPLLVALYHPGRATARVCS